MNDGDFAWSNISSIEGFGAGFNRDDDSWHFYTMPNCEPFPLTLKGWDKGRIDFVIGALRSALARADAKAGERDAIVSWLRKEIAAVNADNSYWGGPHRAAYPDAVRIADAIERGDYRSSPPADAPPVKQSLTSEAIEAVRLMRAYYAAEDARNDCDECDNEGPDGRG